MIRQAQRSMSRGDLAQADASRRLAEAMLDIAIGVNPVTAVARDAYELITGENLLNGEKLTDDQRLLAAIGVLTFGIGGDAKATTHVIEEGANNRTLNKQLLKVESKSADEANALLKANYGLDPPYRPGTRVYTYENVAEEHFSRVYVDGVNRKEGAWLLKTEDVAGLTADQIRTKYALPSTPTRVAEVIVPPRQIIERGAVNKKIFNGDEAVAYQYRLYNPSESIFADGKPLP
jgi:hypothetical protein